MVSTRGKTDPSAEVCVKGHKQPKQTIDVPSFTRAQRSHRASAELVNASNTPTTIIASQARRGRPPKVPMPHGDQTTARTTKGRKSAHPAPSATAAPSSDEASDEDGTYVEVVVHKPISVSNISHLLELSDEENDENCVVASITTFKGTSKRALHIPDNSCTVLTDSQVPGTAQGKRMRLTTITRTPLSPRSNSQQVIPDETSQAAELCTVDCNVFSPVASTSQTIHLSLAAACPPSISAAAAIAANAQQSAVTQAAAATAEVAAAILPAAEVFNPSSEEHVLMARSALSVSRAQNFGDVEIDASEAPVGRQQQFDQLLALLEQSGRHQVPLGGKTMTSMGSVHTAGSGSQTVYASGLPGTGKSLTVTALLRSMRSQQQPPATVWVSCNAFKETSEVFAVLLRECTLELIGRHIEVPSDPAVCHSALVKVLQQSSSSTTNSSSRGPPSHTPRPVIIVLDEIDRLISRDAQDLYQLFTLPALAGPNVSLLAIANSLDLTDRLLPKLRCQGIAPQLVCFPAYSRSQVEAILTTRLKTLPWPVIDQQALEACARNVSQNIGDLRHALKTCSLALDVLLDQNTAAIRASSTTANAISPSLRGIVSLQDMRTALMRCAGGRGGALNAASSTQATILALPTQQQLALLALATAVGITAASVSRIGAAAGGASAAASSPAAASKFVPRVLASPTFSAPSAFQVLSPGVSARSQQQQKDQTHQDSPTHSVKTTTLNGTQILLPGGGGLTPSSRVNGGGRQHTEGLSPVPFKGGKGLPPSPRICGSSPGLAAGSILAGDAGHSVTVEVVYGHYSAFCAKLAIAKMEMSEFGCDVCGRLETDGLLKKGAARGGGKGSGGRRNSGSGAGTGMLTLLVAVRDVQAALRGNVVFRNIVGVPV